VQTIEIEKIAFGGGCHWCTEAIFQSLGGVQKVEQGWVSSSLPEARELSEAVIVHFHPTLISLDTLIEIHLFTHNSTSNHRFRKKYRSAVYAFDKDQEEEAYQILIEKQKLFTKLLVTKVYPFKSFKLNGEKYLNYYASNPKKPFCKMRIEPKLKIILNKYTQYT
jgi:peptide-methionine (S)-S-oxide reductase